MVNRQRARQAIAGPPLTQPSRGRIYRKRDFDSIDDNPLIALETTTEKAWKYLEKAGISVKSPRKNLE
jgi:hypothetical protein